MTESAADRFIAVMAEINALESLNEDPMRHEVRMCRSRALQALSEAMIQAQGFVDIANSMRRSVRDAIAEEINAYEKANVL